MINKRYLISNLVVMVLLVLILAFSLSGFFTVAYAKAVDSQCDYMDYILDFLGNREVLEERVISGGGDNEYLLIETSPSGYAIFAIDEEKYIFVEGAKTTNSPFFKYKNEKLLYLGPTSYYIDKENKYIDIMTNDTVYKENMASKEYDFLSQQKAMQSVPEILSMDSNSLLGATYSEDGYTYIQYADYFKKSINFPSNVNNECGIIALCLLLGYLDTCMNDGFINSSDNFIRNGTYSTFLKTMTASPYTTTELREYLKTFDHRLKVDLIAPDSFVMADMELKATMKDYINKKCPELSNNCIHYSGSIVYTHKNPKNYIDRGFPAILVLVDYEDPRNGQIDKKGKHCVVAYGYKDDTFVTHFGWDEYSNVYLSKYTAYAYYAMEYNGEHVHSKNLTAGIRNYYCICGVKAE